MKELMINWGVYVQVFMTSKYEKCSSFVWIRKYYKMFKSLEISKKE